MYEILAPAGNKECALAAIDSGANALYLGYSSFSARAQAENFDMSALKEIVSYAHVFGVKVYVTMNTLVKQSEVEEFLQTLVAVHNIGADGILLQDIFLGKYIHEHYPEICLHLSTQAGVNNVYGALLAKQYGFSRVVLARETALEDIREIAKVIETEVFVQGALCTCFSGECYFSSFIGGNSGNRGRCKQPCRKRYTYDTGDREQNYALSLSDLSVGEKVQDLLSAGVYSLKIEGRMRSKEYVAAAVRYYKRLLEGKPTDEALSDLKRTFNRGNYTQGLAFGQDKRFLSTAVQGHIGEKVGVVKVLGGKYYVESKEPVEEGDGFKILRDGKEVGGATFLSNDKRGFFIGSRNRLKNGDGVFITTDRSLQDKLLYFKHIRRTVNVCVTGREGENMTVSCQELGVKVTSSFLLQTAKNSPLSAEEVVNCFLKTDEYPVTGEVSVNVEGNCFVPKSLLNGLRREFYAAVYEKLVWKDTTQYTYTPVKIEIERGENHLTAAIGAEFIGEFPDICIVKPTNYTSALPVQGKVSYLYLPPFLSGKEIAELKEVAQAFDGIYCEGSYGILLAEKWGKKLFLGTGCNLSNLIAVNEVKEHYYAVSKELDLAQQSELRSKNSFVLSAGGLKLMDLIYCPFGKKCSACENRNEYTLTDEGDRNFTVFRYKVGGNCRFELYNCSYLLSPQTFSGQLFDFTGVPYAAKQLMVRESGDQEKMKKVLFPVTNGHGKKSVL